MSLTYSWGRTYKVEHFALMLHVYDVPNAILGVEFEEVESCFDGIFKYI